MDNVKNFFEQLLALPVFGPLIGLLRSRKFIAACIALGVNMLVAQAPSLEPMKTEIVTVLTSLAGLYILGTAIEDAAEKRQ